MSDNPLYTNTKGLTDGDFLLSPSLTNLYEAIHGNGIMLYEDSATSTSGRRNTPADLPGAISHSVNVLTIKGGYATIDGLLVDFGGGYDAGHDDPLDHVLKLNSDTINGGGTELTDASHTALLVVYVSTEGGNHASTSSGFDTSGSAVKHIQVEMGTPVTSGFPVTPEAFLEDSKAALASKQSTVLAVLKVNRDASGGTDNDLNLNVTDVYDMRTFIRPNAPIYMSPMTKDDVAVYTNRINNHTLIDGMHGSSNENGSLTASKFGALWMTKNTSNESVLYFSGEQGAARYSWRLGPNAVILNENMTSTVTFTKDEGTHFLMHASGGSTVQLNPQGEFPLSHTVHVFNYSDDSTQIQFNGSERDGVSGDNAYTLNAGQSIIFVWAGSTGGLDGDNGWQQAFVSGNVNAVVAGSANGEIQFKNGSNFAASSNLSFNNSTNVLTISGKVSMDNLLENPTGIDFTKVATNPGTTAAETLWVDSDDNRLYLGANKIAFGSDSFGATTLLELTDTPANFTSAANKFLQVNGAGNAVIFDTIASGDLPTNLNTVTSIGPAGTLTVNQDLTVTGDLIVSGDSTTLNVGTIEVEDLTIELAKGAGGDSAADGAGIIVDSTGGDKDILYDNTAGVLGWAFSENIVPKNAVTKTVGTTARPWNNGHFTSLNSGALTATTITGSSTVAIDTDVLKVDVSNDRVGIKQGTPLATLQMKSVGFDYATSSISNASSSSAHNITLFNKGEFRTAKVLVELVNNGTDGNPDRYESHEVIVTHNGTTAKGVAYGSVRTDNTVNFCTFDASISGSDVRLDVTTPSTEDGDQYAIKLSWQGMTA